MVFTVLPLTTALDCYTVYAATLRKYVIGVPAVMLWKSAGGNKAVRWWLLAILPGSFLVLGVKMYISSKYANWTYGGVTSVTLMLVVYYSLNLMFTYELIRESCLLSSSLKGFLEERDLDFTDCQEVELSKFNCKEALERDLDALLERLQKGGLVSELGLPAWPAWCQENRKKVFASKLHELDKSIWDDIPTSSLVNTDIVGAREQIRIVCAVLRYCDRDDNSY